MSRVMKAAQISTAGGDWDLVESEYMIAPAAALALT